MKKQMVKIVVLAMSMLLLLAPLHIEAKGKANEQNQTISQASFELKSALRKILINHTIWTRSYIVSALSSLPDQEKVLERLLKNQDDLGNAMKPYYGEEGGNQLAKLFREHILIAGKVVDAAKSNNDAELKKHNIEWYQNADEIAQFLSKANPNWNQNELKEILYKHLKLVTDQVVSRLHQDWDAEIAAVDQNEDHMIMFADTIANGMIMQFPERF